MIGSTVNTEDIRFVSSSEGSRNVVRTKFWTLDIEKFTNEHLRRKGHFVAVSVKECQSNIFWKKDVAPGLFDLEEKFLFKSTEWKIQLMTI